MPNHEGTHRAFGPSTLEINTGAAVTSLLPVVEQPDLTAAPDCDEQALKYSQRLQEQAEVERVARVRRLATFAIVAIPEGILTAGIGVAELLIRH